MFAPANLVHHQEFYEFSQEFDLAAKPQYFMQPAYSAPVPVQAPSQQRISAVPS
jgi:hypothetical protein